MSRRSAFFGVAAGAFGGGGAGWVVAGLPCGFFFCWASTSPETRAMAPVKTNRPATHLRMIILAFAATILRRAATDNELGGLVPGTGRAVGHDPAIAHSSQSAGSAHLARSGKRQ